VSAAAYGGLSLLLAAVLGTVLRRPLGWALAVLVVLTPPLRELSRLATPDALSALVCFTAVMLLVVYRRLRSGCALLVASILVRPDNVLLGVAVLVWLATDRRARLHAAWGLLGAVVVSAASVFFVPLQSWSALMVHTFQHRLLTTAEMRSATLTTGEYARLLTTGIDGSLVLHRSLVPVFALVSCVGTFAAYRSERYRAFVWLNLLLWSAALAHYLGFPLLADRFFVPHYLIVTTLAVIALRDVASNNGWTRLAA